MPPAVRVLDSTGHGSPLSPGIGSLDVWIGGKPAWRAIKDIHICPVGPPPHGLGKVMFGSSTVFINGCPAVRTGDSVVEIPGGTNQITGGDPSVLIG